MKRFLLFRFKEYYPSGGWDDFVGSFDSPEEAVKEDARLMKLPMQSKWTDYAQVVDSTTGQIVFSR